MVLLRFATANLLHGLDPASGQVREPDLRAAAKLLDADIIGLQEVDRAQPRSGGTDQAEIVAAETGAAWWRFVPTLAGPLGAPGAAPGPAYGIALICRLPVLEWHELRFPPSRWSLPLLDASQRRLRPVADEPRVAVASVAVGPDGPFTVATTHLSFVPGRNVFQLRRILRWLSGLPGPRFLLGDLNLPGRLPRVVTRWDDLARVATYPSWRPRVQWDHMLTDGPAQVVGASAVRLPVSDHRGLRVDLYW